MIKQNRRRKSERGVALLVALLGLLLLAVVGVGMMFMSDTENSVNNNYRDSQVSYFASRAGLENVRALLGGANLQTQANALDGVMPSSTAGVIYVLNKTGNENIDPTSGDFVDDELCQEQFSALNTSLNYTTVQPGVPCAAPSGLSFQKATGLNVNTGNPAASDIPFTGTASALPFKWVRITNKQNLMGLVAPTGPDPNSTVDNSTNYSLQVCFDGKNEFTISSGKCSNVPPPGATPVWLLTSLAVTPKIGNRPGSKRVTQMEVAFSPPLLPPGVVSAEAPLSFNGTSAILDAMDNCSCDPTTCTTDPTTGITSCNQRAPNGNLKCNSPYKAAYTAGTVSTSGGPTAVTSSGNTLTGNASTQNVSPWPYNIPSLINSYIPGATQPSWASQCSGTTNLLSIPPTYVTCKTQTGGTYGTFPGMDPTTGALNNNPPLGTQTTYIPGSVHLSGSPSGAGVLVVNGDLIIDSGFKFYGLVLVQGQVIFEGGGSAGTNIYGSILAGGDVSNQKQCLNTDLNLCTDSIGGNVHLHYDVCALKNSGGATSPRLLATHEIQY